MRYARWVAVSTPAQAKEDKVSLDVQLEKTAHVAQAKGWTETAGPFSVPGQSRTRWVSLRDAEQNIPALRLMLDSAKRGEYDVLVMYDFNRLRDLLDQVARVLADYHVQMYSLAQPVEPQTPEEFDPFGAETSAMTQKFSGLISQSEINTLRRHYRDKMPSRITVKGLHAGLGNPPYGYRRPTRERDVVLVPVPSEVTVILQIKDWFLSGVSLTEVAHRLNQAGIPSPRGKSWWYPAVAYILGNAFYAGRVSFGATRRQRDRRTGTVKRYKGTPVTAEGKHARLWDEATYLRIRAELDRRGQAHTGVATRQLSRLLHCALCGAVLWAQVTPAGKYWRCSSGIAGHAYLRDDDALEAVIAAMVADIGNPDALPMPSMEDRRPMLEASLRDLRTRRRRWMDLYETGELEKRELAGRIKELDDRIAQEQAQLDRASGELAASDAVRDRVRELAEGLDALPDWIRGGDKLEINAELHGLFESITVDLDKSVTLHWR